MFRVIHHLPHYRAKCFVLSGRVGGVGPTHTSSGSPALTQAMRSCNSITKRPVKKTYVILEFVPLPDHSTTRQAPFPPPVVVGGTQEYAFAGSFTNKPPMVLCCCGPQKAAAKGFQKNRHLHFCCESVLTAPSGFLLWYGRWACSPRHT